MEQKKIVLLEPVAHTITKEIPLAKRLENLNKRTLGILWNSKPNGNILLRRIQELIFDRFSLENSVWRQKPISDRAATYEIKDLVLSADFIINGPGD